VNFLYDIGRVLLDFDFESSIARILPPDATDHEVRLGKMLARKDDFETGKIETNDYIAWALETLGSTASHDEFSHAWRNIFTPNEPMWRCVRQLAADGHKLTLFSNINGIHSPWIFDEYPEFSLFHGAVLSYQTGFIKPQPEIYQYAIAAHGLIPEETIYIDDLPQNCATGRALGFRTWQYDLHDHAAFEAWLAKELTTSPV
jgi:FMN phosphatase YigB (HAD superfamily)